ncbi:MAG: acyl-CoA dehydrogenase [Rubrivivax sp.]|nr:acyl-CoA dehydrogenase [Rubrivivax sp.]
MPGPEERMLLRESVRGFLAEHWPAAGAVERSDDRAAVAALWRGLVGQGLAALGNEPGEGGVRESVLVMEEMGRAACPAPMAGALLANLLLERFGAGDAHARAWLSGLHGASGGSGMPMRLAVAPHLGPDDAQAGTLRIDDGQASGTLAFVDGAMHATHVLVVPTGTPGTLACIDLAGGGVQLHPARAMGLVPGAAWSELRLHNAGASTFALAPAAAAALPHLLRLLCLARALGAARRAFELAVDYAKERRQFGQPIGRFQAVQHKLANNLIALEGVRLTLANAAAAFDLGSADAPYFAATAFAFGAQALRQVALETHHAFGAIGYAEEHEAPRHFRRAHLDGLALGGAARARAEVAALLLDDDTATLPEYDLGEAGNALRNDVREWLREHWSGERKAAFDRRAFHEREFDPEFACDLGRTGWIGLGWPTEHGGQGRGPREQLAFMEVMERAETPRYGAAVQVNALLMHGTAEQRARYLPEILRGEAMHGMGYSEPEAGSDLASLRMSAVLSDDGREWVLNGQKIWTTTYWGKYMFLAARTERDLEVNRRTPHAGISMFIVPMDTPGITVKPARTMYDGSFANSFYDDVRIPAENIVGPVNGGWKVLTDALANERGLVGGGIVLKVAHAFDLLCRDVRADPALRRDPLVRDRIGQLASEIEVGRQLMIHCAELAESGTTPPEMGAISKVFSGELMERFGEAALDLLGPRAALSQGAPGALRHGRYEQNLRHSLMWVISIGTNEIQRSLIAQRGLGLPR